MLNADSQFPNQTPVDESKLAKNSKFKLSRLSIGVHSMPKTSEKSLRLWFILGGIILVLFVLAVFVLLN